MEKRKLALIVAMDSNGVIGKNGKLPWHCKKDLAYFRRMTTGHVVLMGHRTYRSIGHPLPERKNIVLSRWTDLKLADCEVFSSLERALERAWRLDPLPFVIGGAELFRLTLPLATHLYITLLRGRWGGDTFFPKWNRNEWRLLKEEIHPELQFLLYERKAIF